MSESAMTTPEIKAHHIRRRALLTGASAAAFAGISSPQPGHAQSAGAAYPNELVAAARKEGSVVLHSSDDAALLAQLARAFQASFPGIAVQLGRADTEAQLKEISDTAGRPSVDVLTSTDLAAMVDLRRAGRLALYVPEETRRWPEGARDPDGFYSFTALGLMVLGYNSQQVMPEQAPKSYADLLGARFMGKLVAAHPGLSGGSLTATFVLANALGWPFFEQLARQAVLQVQSATEAVEKISSGERSAMLYGSEQAALRLRVQGGPVNLVYPADGTAAVPSATAVLREAPHPNAARLFATWIVSREAQELVVASGARSFHPGIREPAGRLAMNGIKLLTPDPILLSAEADLVKQFYTQLFSK